jgi:hypothetical protein
MSYETLKKKAKETNERKVTAEKATRLNLRDPKKGEPISKEAPEVSRVMGPPAKG